MDNQRSIKKREKIIIPRRRGRPRNPDKKIYVPKGTPHTGRPLIYSQELASLICEKLMDGCGLKEICAAKNMPAFRTVFGWLDAASPTFQREFLQAYIAAREIQAEILADEIKAIADNDNTRIITDTMRDKNGNILSQRILEKDTVAARALKIESRKWLAAHLKPRKFSDKLQLTGADGKDLIPQKTELIVNFIKPDPEIIKEWEKEK
ncbi:MAG: hypothetical protein ACLQBQ_09640 [Smithella sp.]